MNLPHLQKPLGPKTLRVVGSTLVQAPASGISRQTAPNEDHYNFDSILYPHDPSSSWRTLTAMRKNLLELPYQRLASISVDLSQAVNKGLYDFLRFTNPGYLLRNSDVTNEDTTAVDASMEFIGRLAMYHGSFPSMVDSMFSGVFLSGGIFIELVLDPTGRFPVDIAINDPNSARFVRSNDPVRGSVFRLAQQTQMGIRYLDEDPLVKYVGFDKVVDNPFGRPIIGPSVHASLVLLSIIDILQKVLAKNALSKTDYELDAEELLKLIDRNPDLAGNDEATADFITQQIDSVKRVVESLEPEQDYVHMSTVKVNHSSGTVQTNVQGIDSIVQMLRQDVVNGFKGVSALSNILDSTTETHIRSQLEYYVAALSSLQDEVGQLFSGFFNIGNQVQGIASDIEFAFKRQRTADRMAEAEIEKAKTELVIKKLDAGIIDPLEAREEIASLNNELIVNV